MAVSEPPNHEAPGANGPGGAGRWIPYKWELIVVLWFTFFMSQADRQIFGNLSTIIRDDLGLTKVQFGLVGTLFMIVYGIMVPLAGYAGDVFRRKWVVLFSIAMTSTATLLTGLTAGLVPALLALLLFRSLADGVGGACYYPAANSLIGQFHHKTRATAMAIHQTALYCGIIASSLAALIGQNYGWRNAFYLFGVVGIVMAVVVLLRVQDTPMPRAPSNGSSGQERAPTIPEVLRHVLSKRTVLLLAVAFAGHVFVENGYRTWVPSFLEEDFGLSTFQASFWSMAAHYAGAFLGVTLGGRFSDRLAVRRRAVRMEFQYLGMILASPFIIWMGMAAGPVTCCIALALFGLFRGVYDSNLFAAPFEVIEPRYRASAVGLMLACAFVMGASAPALLGWMADLMDMRTAMASMAAVYLLSGVIVLLARYKTFDGDTIDESPEEPMT